MNVVFISPNFPVYFYNFCSRLKERGVNVLGIGDCRYDELPEHTIHSLNEYYKVDSLEDYEDVYRACAYFTWKYGKIDWIESENEYWLELEATLRNDFKITTGPKIQNMSYMKNKSKMKEIYHQAGIPTAKYHHIHDYENARDFANEIGYPIIVKPDNGVGASLTYKLHNIDEFNYFFATKDPHVQFIMEEVVPGHVETFDGITNQQGDILICASHVMLSSIMDNVNDNLDTVFYSQPIEGTDLYEIGKKAVQAFNTKGRFFHFEFFRLDQDKEGLGKKGDIVGLEVNMRAPGAFIPEIMNFTYNVDVYTIWADMIKYNQCFYDIKRQCYIGYAGRREGVNYLHSYEDIRRLYSYQIALETDVDKILSNAMGSHVFIVKANSKEELMNMLYYILEHQE